MKILYLCSEAYPFVKTGGLADVMYALPRKMRGLGHEISLFLPKYDLIPKVYMDKMKYVNSIQIHDEIYNLYALVQDGINYYFIENRTFFERGHIYGDLDEDVQYTNFCEAILKFLIKLGLEFDVIHCNDWQTGVFPYFMKTRYHIPTKTVYTIHNLLYQGKFNNYSFNKLGYMTDRYNLNFMEIGIEYSDVVNTVSPTYAKEIKYPYFAQGLEWITNKKNILGILNGIDYDYYKPIDNKKEYKTKLLNTFNLPDNGNMLICVISRLVEGKGIDLIVARLEDILIHDKISVIIIGTGNKYYENFFSYLESKYPDKIKTYMGNSEELALLTYKGADCLLMPSRYEPCGLSQMIAMRYGTVPIVRETGGLKDTVKAFDTGTKKGNGFTFSNFNADDMLYTIRYAKKIYFEQKENFNILRNNCLNTDNSWNIAAKLYEKLYKN